MKWSLLVFLLAVSGVSRAVEIEPSEFREFSDKQGQTIEARILSVSEDFQTLNLERRDGQKFELAATVLSLDDQQFLRNWLSPPAPVQEEGKFRAFGKLRDGNPIDTEALKEIKDIVSIHAMKPGWFALRESGEVLTFQDKFPGLTDVKHLSVNTVWVYLTKRDGKVGGPKGGHHYPDFIQNAVQCVGGGGHAAVLLQDGSVKVWGNAYGKPDQPIDPPQALSGIVSLASS